jgi:MFS family permease
VPKASIGSAARSCGEQRRYMSSSGASWQGNRAFRVLLSGSSVSMLGSRITMIAYPMLVLYLTRSPVYAGLAVFAATAPSILFYMPAGALVDRWDPRRTMLVSEVARGLVIGTIVCLLWLHKDIVLLIIGLATIEEIFEIFATLAERRYISMLVGPELARDASTRTEARSHVIVLIGRPLGGLLFEIGPVIPFCADLVSFAASFLTLPFIRQNAETPIVPAPRMRLRVEIREGLKWLMKNGYVRVSIILNSWMTLISQALILVFIVEARSQRLSSLAIGVVLASSGFGGVLGAMLGKAVDRLIGSHFQILKGRSRVKIQLCIWSAGLLVLAVSLTSYRTFWCMAIVMAVFGFIGAMGNMELETYISEKVPQTMIGRLVSIDRLTSFSMCAVGPAIGGFLAGYSGTRAAVWWLFVMTIVPTLFVAGRALIKLSGRPSRARTAILPRPELSNRAPALRLSSASPMSAPGGSRSAPVRIAIGERVSASELSAAFCGTAANGDPVVRVQPDSAARHAFDQAQQVIHVGLELGVP